MTGAVFDLMPGDVALGTAGDQLKTLLGSCVSVILTDPRRTVGAMAIASAGPIRRGRGSTEDFVPAITRSRSPAPKPTRTSARWERLIAGSRGTSCAIALTRWGAVRVIRMPRSTELRRAMPTLPVAR